MPALNRLTLDAILRNVLLLDLRLALATSLYFCLRLLPCVDDRVGGRMASVESSSLLSSPGEASMEAAPFLARDECKEASPVDGIVRQNTRLAWSVLGVMTATDARVWR